MRKKVFGLVVFGMLIGIFVVNLIQNVSANKDDKRKANEIQVSNLDISPNDGLSVGDLPPDFQLETLDGEIIRLSDMHGKKVLLNFWATWCPPCKAEMPHMQRFYETKAKEYDLEFVAVNLTTAEKVWNKKEQVEKFVKEYDLTFPIPLDTKGNVADQYRIITIPTTYIIGSDGIIKKSIFGPMDEETIEKLVKDVD